MAQSRKWGESLLYVGEGTSWLDFSFIYLFIDKNLDLISLGCILGHFTPHLVIWGKILIFLTLHLSTCKMGTGGSFED